MSLSAERDLKNESFSESSPTLKAVSDGSSLAENIAISVRDVSVNFRSYEERPTTLKESLLSFLQTGSFSNYSTFNALKNISFDVPKGSVFGIIGSNGAGKSTTLKVLSGVLPPTSGEVILRGSLDSLIQLGAGFDTELNAIENIYLNGSLHGFSRDEIKEKIPKILEFAELKDFATTPIKYYSSGMYARLGFSVAIDRDPDILIVDEILAVGDQRFQEKSKKVFDRFLENKKTIIMVSHNLKMLEEISDQIALLSKGELVFVGEPSRAIELYEAKEYKSALSS